jgi:hypothetical protein
MSADVQTSVLEAVVEAQEKIMDEVWGDSSKVPQMWCLYKEVQDYFEAGMKVPDHVILLWTEDNMQNIRRLPVGDEKKRSGGAGVYYVSSLSIFLKTATHGSSILERSGFLQPEIFSHS